MSHIGLEGQQFIHFLDLMGKLEITKDDLQSTISLRIQKDERSRERRREMIERPSGFQKFNNKRKQMTTYTFSDDTISQIARLLQIAILSGTDIVDNLRSLQVIVDDAGKLSPDPQYLEQFDQNLNRMIAAIAAMSPPVDMEE